MSVRLNIICMLHPLVKSNCNYATVSGECGDVSRFSDWLNNDEITQNDSGDDHRTMSLFLYLSQLYE